MSSLPPETHGSFEPADVRETDNVVARVRRRVDGSSFETVRVWKLSPLGVDLVQPARSHQYSAGERLDLQLVVDGKRSQFLGLVVLGLHVDNGQPLFGIRLLAEDREPVEYKSDQRDAMRWVCSTHHLPRAIAPSPGKFNEFLSFQIRNISESGLLLVTSIDNSFLIPKMRLTLSINLPMVGDTVQSVEVVWMRIGTDGASDVLEVGVLMADLGYRTRSLLGQYLVQFARDVTLEQLVASGFSPLNVTNGIRFDSVKTEQDYDDYLTLRSPGASKSASAEQYVDAKDRFCRLVVGRIGGNIVAGARVRYPELKDHLSCEEYFKWSDTLPRPDQLIEVDDIQTDVDPVFKTQTILALFNYICTACTTDVRQYVIVYSKDYVDFRFAGWRLLTETPTAAVLIGNAYEAIGGKLTNPFKWNLVWRRSAAFMLKAGTLKPTGTDALILKAYMAVGPLIDIWVRFQSRKRLGKNVRKSRVAQS